MSVIFIHKNMKIFGGEVSMKCALAITMSLMILAPAVSAQEAAPLDKPAKAKKICRTEIPTGRRTALRTCATAVEWEKWDAENAVAGKEFTDRTAQHSGISLPARNPMTGLPQ
jgi:hypothetical protein